MSLGLWRVSDNIINYLKENLEEGSVIIEFGSGDGTDLLSKNFKMISIEEDSNWVDKYDSTYLHVPITPYTEDKFPSGYHLFGTNDIQWHDPDILKEKLLSIDSYDLILVDGPKGYRGGLFDYIDLFDTSKPMVFDDLHDKWHMMLAEKIAEKLGRSLQIFNREDGTPEFGIIN